MKHFLLGAAIIAVMLIALLAIHVFCNMHGIELDPVPTGIVASVCAMLFYHGLTKNEKK